MVKQYSKKDATVLLLKNFTVREFACKCGRCETILVDEKLVAILQQLRDHFGASVNINSGYRCQKHNAEVGGDPLSSHMQGMAADIWVSGVAPREVAKYAESIGVQRIGLYDTFVHIGSGSKKLFWINHNSNQVNSFDATPELTCTITMPVLKRYMKGGTVASMQALLIGFGYNIDRDGSFGPATEIALRTFQKKNGLANDGSCGPATWAKLLGV